MRYIDELCICISFVANKDTIELKFPLTLYFAMS